VARVSALDQRETAEHESEQEGRGRHILREQVAFDQARLRSGAPAIRVVRPEEELGEPDVRVFKPRRFEVEPVGERPTAVEEVERIVVAIRKRQRRRGGRQGDPQQVYGVSEPGEGEARTTTGDDRLEFGFQGDRRQRRRDRMRADARGQPVQGGNALVKEPTGEIGAGEIRQAEPGERAA